MSNRLARRGCVGLITAADVIHAIEERLDNEPEEIKRWYLNSLRAGLIIDLLARAHGAIAASPLNSAGRKIPKCVLVSFSCVC
jgi:hypothetical protein